VSIIGIGGDGATTSALALAAGWPEAAPGEVGAGREVIVVEADPTGGSLAAWLDTPLSPSLSSVVTSLHQNSLTGTTGPAQWSTIDAMVRRSASGIRFVPAPFRTREARGALSEAELSLFPLLADVDHAVALVDVGRIDPLRLPAALLHADLVLLIHRQDASSAPAATVRLERLAETIEAVRDTGATVGLAIIGEDPFSLGEVVDFASPNGPTFVLAPDPLSAAVLAGRTGVSTRRLSRLPLMRSAALAASELDRLVEPHHAADTVTNGGAA
jgi:hypothetical protein